MSLLAEVRRLTGLDARQIAAEINISHASVLAYVNNKRTEYLTEEHLQTLETLVQNRIKNHCHLLELIQTAAPQRRLRTRTDTRAYTAAEPYNPTVYALRFNDRIKIGYTTCPERRLAAYKLHIGKQAEFVYQWAGTQAEEAKLQQVLQPYNKGGEWFDYCAEVQKVLAQWREI